MRYTLLVYKMQNAGCGRWDAVSFHWSLYLSLFFSILLATFSYEAGAQSLSDLALRSFSLDRGSVTIAGKSTYLTYHIAPLEDAYNGVIVSGLTSLESPEGWIRFDRETEWKPLIFLKAGGSQPFLAGYRGEQFRTAEGFTLRFKVMNVKDLALSEGGVFDNREDADWQAKKSVETEPVEVRSGGSAIVPPLLISRAQWNADPFIRGEPIPLARPDYTRMTFHHTACCAARTYEEGIAQVKAIQDFHQDVRGWSDIGYQFLLDQEGRLYQGRPFLDNRTDLQIPPVLAQGAHVGGFNTGNIGVAVLGCYHPPEGSGCMDMLSQTALDSLTTVFAFLNENYGVPTNNLLGHRDQGSTACPGDNNYVLLPKLREDVDTLVLLGNQPIASGTISATLSEGGVVRLDGSLSEIVDVASFRIEREIGGTVSVVFIGTETASFFVTDSNIPLAGVARYALYATSSRGQDQLLADVEIDLESPSGYILAQGFPNPFSSSTTIRYYLDREGVVRLDVFNSYGERIKNLVNAFQHEKRWYDASFSGEGLASGVYFYRLTVEGFSGVIYDETRTLHLIR